MMNGFISRIKVGIEQLFRRSIHIMSKLSLVIIFTTLIGVGGAWLLFWSQNFNTGVIKWLVVMELGISSGIIARLVFYHNTLLMGWLSAWIAQAAVLLLLNFLTMGQTGFNLYQAQSGSINWDGLSQLGLGATLAWTFLSIWKTSTAPKEHLIPADAPDVVTQIVEPAQIMPIATQPVQQEVAPLKKKPARRLKTEHAPKVSAPASSPSRYWSLGNITTGLHKRVHATANALTLKFKTTPVSKELTIKGSTARKQKPLKPANISLPKKARKARRMPIQLIGEEEHRCPYCLVSVDPNDPEGVVVCSICHSYHHKSCWDITGTCQVPHIYS